MGFEDDMEKKIKAAKKAEKAAKKAAAAQPVYAAQAPQQMMYQIQVPPGVGPGMNFQANIGGQMMNIACPPGVPPGGTIQVPGPAPVPQAAVAVPMQQPMMAAQPPAYGAPGEMQPLMAPQPVMMQPVMMAPQQQVMNESDGGLNRILGPQKGVMIRQKLDKWEIILPMWEKRNKYKVAAYPEHLRGEPFSKWEDKVFKKALKENHILTMKEKSECFDRAMCGRYRTMKIKVKAGDDAQGSNDNDGKILEFDRPCSLGLNCCNLVIIGPQQMTVRDKHDKEFGTITQAVHLPGSCCFKNYWDVRDGNGLLKYVIQDDLCNGCNFCAPSICVEARTLQIMDPEIATEQGQFVNVFPGCNMRACLGDADNYVMEFPDSATVEDKALLLGASVLIDFMLFEKDEQNNENGMAIQM